MIRRPPRSTLSSSSAASDVYKRQGAGADVHFREKTFNKTAQELAALSPAGVPDCLQLMEQPTIHTPEPESEMRALCVMGWGSNATKTSRTKPRAKPRRYNSKHRDGGRELWEHPATRDSGFRNPGLFLGFESHV
eukprot:TRINITY_DN11494_c0_g1_i1.p1 TRINITY_DN11494_c0_g1~~TRINITY_DN11494_c0_g1_i1.p1  ORF type:complete len:135 (-),score=16.37 TRINITY_DN11494_c0_g1_i1:132-536(-)